MPIKGVENSLSSFLDQGFAEVDILYVTPDGGV
jgi:hypothetical protein